MMTHHSVTTSSLRIKILKTDKFDGFRVRSILAVKQTYLEKLPHYN